MQRVTIQPTATGIKTFSTMHITHEYPNGNQQRACQVITDCPQNVCDHQSIFFTRILIWLHMDINTIL